MNAAISIFVGCLFSAIFCLAFELCRAFALWDFTFSLSSDHLFCLRVTFLIVGLYISIDFYKFAFGDEK